MSLKELTKVSGRQDLRFNDIWKIYDDQFSDIRNFLISLGDKYVVQDFTGGSSKVLQLQESYDSGQLFLYVNGVLQWKDTDYEETSSKSITLLRDISINDEVKVIIIRSNILQTDTEMYVDEIKKVYNSTLENMDKANQFLESVHILEAELESKRSEFESQKLILEDFLKDFDSKVLKSEENMSRIEEIKTEIDSDLVESEAYLKKVQELKDAIEALSLLEPEQIVENEVVLARGGATTLGTRLDGMMYKFPSIKDMQQCFYLKDGDECIIVDESNVADLGKAKIFRICSKSENIPSNVEEYYRISVPDYQYAYVVNEMASVSYVDREIDESSFGLNASMLCQSYGLYTLILEFFGDTSGFNMKDDTTSKFMDAYWNSAKHLISYNDTAEVLLESATFTLDGAPEYLMSLWDSYGDGVVEVYASFNGGTKKFEVENGELIDLSNVLYDDGSVVRPTVKLNIFIKLSGDVTLKNIAYSVR